MSGERGVCVAGLARVGVGRIAGLARVIVLGFRHCGMWFWRCWIVDGKDDRWYGAAFAAYISSAFQEAEWCGRAEFAEETLGTRRNGERCFEAFSESRVGYIRTWEGCAFSREEGRSL